MSEEPDRPRRTRWLNVGELLLHSPWGPAAFALGCIAGFLVIASSLAVLAGGGDPPKREPVRDLPGPAFQEESSPRGELINSGRAAFIHGGFLVYPVGQDPEEDPPEVAFRRWEGWHYQERLSSDESRGDDLALVGLKGFDGVDTVVGGLKAATLSIGVWTAPDGRQEAQGVSLTLESGQTAPILVHRGRAHYYTTLGLFPFAIPELPNHQLTVGEVAGRSALFLHRKPGVTTRELQQVLFVDGPFVTTIEGYVDRFTTLLEVAEAVARNSSFTLDGTPAAGQSNTVTYHGKDGRLYSVQR